MATKKTTSKKAQPKTEADGTPSFKVPARLIELQRRSLESQHKAFDRTYDAANSFQERREDQVNEWLASSRLVPSEVAELAAEWTQASRAMRTTYKKSVDNTFAIADSWVDGLSA